MRPSFIQRVFSSKGKNKLEAATSSFRSMHLNHNEGEEEIEMVNTAPQAKELAGRLFMSNMTQEEFDMILRKDFSTKRTNEKVMMTSRMISSETITNAEIWNATTVGIKETIDAIQDNVVTGNKTEAETTEGANMVPSDMAQDSCVYEIAKDLLTEDIVERAMKADVSECEIDNMARETMWKHSGMSRVPLSFTDAKHAFLNALRVAVKDAEKSQ